jgi:hypothetical protein
VASKLAISQALRQPGAGTVPYLRQHLVALKRMREELDKAGIMQPAEVAQAAARPAAQGTGDSAAAGVGDGGTLDCDAIKHAFMAVNCSRILAAQASIVSQPTYQQAV